MNLMILSRNQKIKNKNKYRDSTEKGKILKKGKNIGTPLRLSKPNKYWVERSPKKGAYGYVPYVEDTVLGIFVECKADNDYIYIYIYILLYIQKFFVDIKGPTIPILPGLAYEGSSNRNIYKFEPTSDIMLSYEICNPKISFFFGKAAEFGLLKDECDIFGSPILTHLGCTSTQTNMVRMRSLPPSVVVIGNAIVNSESLSAVRQKIMMDKLVQRIK
ncbi:Ribosomal RNA-processing protein 40 [Citrus sinensis]|uniref:Ribosomal RNA-processing protein 40 n=1 Tax=Citrus sinensis TaxID=2711 RepID=A0ACB8JXA0_CITSI|nr:Ribosomal RNA-processing protein 40 [Citrus sinensis]